MKYKTQNNNLTTTTLRRQALYLTVWYGQQQQQLKSTWKCVAIIPMQCNTVQCSQIENIYTVKMVFENIENNMLLTYQHSI